MARNRHQARRISPRKFPNKVAVSRSRPLTCSPPPLAFTAAAVTTLPSVNFIFNTPKFAVALAWVHAEWREKFANKAALILTSFVANILSLNFETSQAIYDFRFATARRRTVEMTWGKTGYAQAESNRASF